VSDETKTEAEAIAELAVLGVAPEALDPAELYVYRGDVLNLEKHLDSPFRMKGNTRLFDDASFSTLTQRFKTDTTMIYADLYRFEFVSVFNDASPVEGAAWGDHRAVLTLKATPEWNHWIGPNGQMLSQEAFAEHIETGADEVVSPSGAEMLELAQTFHAKNNVAFKQATILASGERQFAYEETIAAKAGQTGQLTIPKEFELGIAPFEGTDKYKVVARLRYRIREGALSIGYKLDRPELVQRAAFDDVAGRISNAADLSLLAGLPPVGV
jgi:uncharacterized protein YfdQ (DUF2303 family)